MPPPGYQPFLHAICANPDDDTARLVYADWLDENGDPDRAEYIRLTIDWHLDPPADDRPDPRVVRAQELLNRHRSEWTVELPGPSRLWRDAFWWYAGFPAVVSVVRGAGLFLRHVDEIVRQTPARALVLARLSDPRTALTALGACPAVAHFRSIFTARTRVGDIGAEAIECGPHFAGLTELHLSNNAIGDVGAFALARSRHLGNLTELSLERNPIGADAAEALRARFGDRVKLSAQG